MTVRRLLLLAGLAAVLGNSAAAFEDYPEIEYASPDQSVWTTRLNERGEPDNPLFPYAERLFARAGLKWHGKTYPAARMFRNLRDGSAQFSILVRSPALEECCLLSRKPVASTEIRAYFLAGKPPVRSREDLYGRQVITVHGYTYGGLLKDITDERNRVGNHAAPSHQAAFTMLERGRADYVIDYAGPAGEVLATQPIPALRSELLSRQDVYLVLSRRYPDAEKVMARLEREAEALEAEKNRKK